MNYFIGMLGNTSLLGFQQLKFGKELFRSLRYWSFSEYLHKIAGLKKQDFGMKYTNSNNRNRCVFQADFNNVSKNCKSNISSRNAQSFRLPRVQVCSWNTQ